MLTLEEETIPQDELAANGQLVELKEDAEILNIVNITTIARRVLESKLSNMFSAAHRAAHELMEALEDALYDEAEGFIVQVDGKTYMKKIHVEGFKKLLDVVKADTLPTIVAYRSGKLKTEAAKKKANVRVRVYNAMERSFVSLFGEEHLEEKEEAK